MFHGQIIEVNSPFSIDFQSYVRLLEGPWYTANGDAKLHRSFTKNCHPWVIQDPGTTYIS